MKLTANLHTTSRLRTPGATLPLPRMHSLGFTKLSSGKESKYYFISGRSNFFSYIVFAERDISQCPNTSEKEGFRPLIQDTNSLNK